MTNRSQNHRRRARRNPNQVEKAAHRADGILAGLGVRHLLCGGLAVKAHGYERETHDVDFLVGDEAFNIHRAGIVSDRVGLPREISGVIIDYVTAPVMQDWIEEELNTNTTGIVSAEFLIVMKLHAYRPKDKVDTIELLRTDAGLADAVRAIYQLPAKLAERLAVCEKASLK